MLDLGLRTPRPNRIILIFAILGTLIDFTVSRNSDSHCTKRSMKANSKNFGSQCLKANTKRDCEVKVALVLCNGENKQRKDLNFERQISQTLVVIKSILISFKTRSHGNVNDCIQINIVTDQKENFKKLRGHIFKTNHGAQNWDKKFTRHMELVYFPLKYPPSTEWMRPLFRTCATGRLFLPYILPYDSIIYLDTDTILFRSVTDLWSEFKSFGNKTVASMVPYLAYYNNRKTNVIPYYGSTGLNSGVILMNLTRMRSVSWKSRIQSIARKYHPKLITGDQDILNIYFAKYPEELSVLATEWNFRYFQCCSYLQRDGNGSISLIHGHRLTFTHKSGLEPLFHKIFKTFQNIQLTDTFETQQLVNNLSIEIKNAKPGRRRCSCAKYEKFEEYLLVHLRNQN